VLLLVPAEAVAEVIGDGRHGEVYRVR
jgi:hypothetical protein